MSGAYNYAPRKDAEDVETLNFHFDLFTYSNFWRPTSLDVQLSRSHSVSESFYFCLYRCCFLISHVVTEED